MVTAFVPTLPCGAGISAFQFANRGEVVTIDITLIVPPTDLENANQIVKTALSSQPWYGPGMTMELVKTEAAPPKRYYLLLVAHTANGFRIGRDVLYNRGHHRKSEFAHAPTIEYIAQECVRLLGEELAHGGCVDEFLQDQLVVFQALAEGMSLVYGGNRKESLHTETARWVCGEIGGCVLTGERMEVVGIGQKAACRTVGCVRCSGESGQQLQ